MVSRVSGSTPLALMPPRREPRAERVERRAERREPREPRERGERGERRESREPREPRADAPLAAADILHMPIVFADDDAPPPEPPAPARAHAQPGEYRDRWTGGRAATLYRFKFRPKSVLLAVTVLMTA